MRSKTRAACASASLSRIDDLITEGTSRDDQSQRFLCSGRERHRCWNSSRQQTGWAWTTQPGDDFEFRNNIISGSQYAWIREGGRRHYKVINSVFARNKNLVGSGAEPALNFKSRDPAIMELTPSIPVVNKPAESESSGAGEGCDGNSSSPRADEDEQESDQATSRRLEAAVSSLSG